MESNLNLKVGDSVLYLKKKGGKNFMKETDWKNESKHLAVIGNIYQRKNDPECTENQDVCKILKRR